MWKYLKAFVRALTLTLRGETVTPKPARHVSLQAWITALTPLVLTTFKHAESHGYPLAQRQALKVRIDGRPMSMETILGAVRYHATHEYPYLLQRELEHSVTAIYASNLNDQYAVQKLLEQLEASELRAPLTALLAHLNAIPSSQTD